MREVAWVWGKKRDARTWARRMGCGNRKFRRTFNNLPIALNLNTNLKLKKNLISQKMKKKLHVESPTVAVLLTAVLNQARVSTVLLQPKTT